MIICSVWGQRQECEIVDEFAAGQSKLAEGLALGQQRSHRVVSDLTALVKIDLEDVGTVLGKG